MLKLKVLESKDKNLKVLECKDKELKMQASKVLINSKKISSNTKALIPHDVS